MLENENKEIELVESPEKKEGNSFLSKDLTVQNNKSQIQLEWK